MIRMKEVLPYLRSWLNNTIQRQWLIEIDAYRIVKKVTSPRYDKGLGIDTELFVDMSNMSRSRFNTAFYYAISVQWIIPEYTTFKEYGNRMTSLEVSVGSGQYIQSLSESEFIEYIKDTSVNWSRKSTGISKWALIVACMALAGTTVNDLKKDDKQTVICKVSND